MMLLGHMQHGGMRCCEVTMLSLLWGAFGVYLGCSEALAA